MGRYRIVEVTAPRGNKFYRIQWKFIVWFDISTSNTLQDAKDKIKNLEVPDKVVYDET